MCSRPIPMNAFADLKYLAADKHSGGRRTARITIKPGQRYSGGQGQGQGGQRYLGGGGGGVGGGRETNRGRRFETEPG